MINFLVKVAFVHTAVPLGFHVSKLLLLLLAGRLRLLSTGRFFEVTSSVHVLQDHKYKELIMVSIF